MHINSIKIICGNVKDWLQGFDNKNYRMEKEIFANSGFILYNESERVHLRLSLGEGEKT